MRRGLVVARCIRAGRVGFVAGSQQDRDATELLPPMKEVEQGVVWIKTSTRGGGLEGKVGPTTQDATMTPLPLPGGCMRQIVGTWPLK